jgi:hypothetical protein
MKESPKSTRRTISGCKKFKYRVIIDDTPYDTWAFNEEAAVSNAAYRYALDNDEEVGLIMWKIKNDELDMEVEEL